MRNNDSAGYPKIRPGRLAIWALSTRSASPEPPWDSLSDGKVEKLDRHRESPMRRATVARGAPPPSAALVMTGPIPGNRMASGDLHALRLVRYWATRAPISLAVPPGIARACPPIESIPMVSGAMPAENEPRYLIAVVLAMVARAIVYSRGMPSSRIAVGSSSITPDILCYRVQCMRYRSHVVLYVYHIVSQMQRGAGLGTIGVILVERVALSLGRASRWTAFTVDPKAKERLILQGFIRIVST